MAFNSRLSVLCSKEFKVCGAIGNVTSLQKRGPQVSTDTVIGEGNTYEWYLGSLDKNSTLGMYFEVVNQQANQLPAAKQAFLQFQTLYQHPSGRRRMRVSTVSFRYAEPGALEIAPGFDQEAAAALMARFAVFKTELEDSMDVLRWIDRMLIRLASRFADYRKDEPHSFTLSPDFSVYPQFMYHLRRSHFLQTFNASPDETAFYRSVLLRENVMHSLVMIQPALLQYELDIATPTPVLLDIASLKPNVILLLDSYFHVVVWHGETIHAWKDAGYHSDPAYANFARLLNAPAEDAKAILADRFPAPKFIQSHAGGSQARFLLAKVNPSATHNNPSGMEGNMGYSPVPGAAGGDKSVVITDDVSLKVFMEHLVRLAVQS
eukprot:Filipodium_phascolosomae@DN3557_c0_g1_i2.p1